ncbi:hypothetical protein ACTPGT_001134 [Enterococcus hirae]|uniref:hypothetical protein n=1 Tax=Enterococcus sp. C63 TaxID=3231324 RepID=UPI00349FE675
MHNKLQPELNKKLQYLNDRHSYDYYDLSRSKTLQKARIHDIDSKNILITNSKERLTHRSYNHKTFDFDIHTKNKKELKQLEEKYNKSLASLIKQSRKQETSSLNESIKWTIGRLRDVRLHLYVVRNVDRVSSIDLREFCEKYAPRIGENPQRLYGSFQLTLADHLKTSGTNFSEWQSIDKEYQELKKADSEITWNESKKKINELCSKIFQVLEHNGLIEANTYKYKNDLENAVPEISKERSEYVKLGIKDLRKTKKKLYDEIITAYQNGYIDTPSFKENLRDLLEVRYQIAMKKGLKRNVFILMTKAENSVATKSYNYYDLSTSNTLKKAGIHNIDSRMILSKENEYTLNEQVSKINNVFETDELIESQHLKEPRLSVGEGQSSRSSLLDKKDDATPEAINTTLASKIKGEADGLGKPACNSKTSSNTSNQSSLTDKEINTNPEVTQLSGNSKEEGKTGSLDQLTSQTKKTSLFRATYANIKDLQDNSIYQKKARQLSNEEVNNGKVDNGRLSNGQKKELRGILGNCGTQEVKMHSTASPNLVSRINNPKGAVGYDR